MAFPVIGCRLWTFDFSKSYLSSLPPIQGQSHNASHAESLLPKPPCQVALCSVASLPLWTSPVFTSGDCLPDFTLQRAFTWAVLNAHFCLFLTLDNDDSDLSLHTGQNQTWLLFHTPSRQAPVDLACPSGNVLGQETLPEIIRRVLIMIPAPTYLCNWLGCLSPADELWLLLLRDPVPDNRLIEILLVFRIYLLKWNLHTIQFTHLRCKFSSFFYIYP